MGGRGPTRGSEARAQHDGPVLLSPVYTLCAPLHTCCTYYRRQKIRKGPNIIMKNPMKKIKPGWGDRAKKGRMRSPHPKSPSKQHPASRLKAPEQSNNVLRIICRAPEVRKMTFVAASNYFAKEEETRRRPRLTLRPSPDISAVRGLRAGVWCAMPHPCPVGPPSRSF
jgi:hypothetical protein